MRNENFRESPDRKLVKSKLCKMFNKIYPETEVRGGYVKTNCDNLLQNVTEEDFRDDFFQGRGNELRNKFQALHSSAALVVNTFAPFRNKERIKELKFPNYEDFSLLEFEKKCPIARIRGCPPHIDVVISGNSKVVAIESKFTEYLSTPKIKISDSYDDLNSDIGFYNVMKSIKEKEDDYCYETLDVAQLIKHSFGIDNEFKDKDVLFVYLYWEPLNVDQSGPNCKNVFAKHQSEINRFTEQVKERRIKFYPLSYNKLWKLWRNNSPNSWLIDHLNELEKRYQMDYSTLKNA